MSEYTQERAPFARPILKHLPKVIHEGDSKIKETVKWGMPSFVYQGKIVCGIAGFKAHCALWFWKGKAVVGKRTEDGMGNFGRITSVNDLPPATKIKAYVKKAVKLIDQEQALATGSGRRPSATLSQKKKLSAKVKPNKGRWVALRLNQRTTNSLIVFDQSGNYP